MDYKAKSPGTVWYLYQYAKAFATTPFRAATRPYIWTAGKNTTLSVASLVATKFIVPYVVLLPLLPTVLWVGGVGAGLYFGMQTYHSLSALKKSAAVRDFISQRKEKWLRKKAGPALGARIKAHFFNAYALLGATLATAGAAIGATAALQYTGVISSATVVALLGSITLPVVMGVAAAATAAGIATEILCRNKAKKLLGLTAPPPAAARVPYTPGKFGSIRSITAAFENGATAVKTAVISEAANKNAALRAAARRAGK